MAKGCFKVEVNNQIEYDIVFIPRSSEENIPSNQIELCARIEETADIIKAIREEKPKKKKKKEEAGKEESFNAEGQSAKEEDSEGGMRLVGAQPEKNMSFMLASIYNEQDYSVGIKSVMPDDVKKEEAPRPDPGSDKPKEGTEENVKEETNEKPNKMLALTKPKDIYFSQLISLAKVGLSIENVQTKLAEKALDKLQDEILINEGSRVKNAHIKNMGLWALIYAVAMVALGFLLREVSVGQTKFLKFLVGNEIHPYLFVFAGSMVGAWISCVVKKEVLVFKDLVLIEKDMLKNWLRIIFVGVTSVVFLLFLRVAAIEISMGSVKITNIMKDIEIQVFVGVLAGILGNKLAKTLSNKASSIIGETDENKNS